MYLGRIDTTRASKIKEEEKFPIPEQGYMIGKLFDGAECQILLDRSKQTIHVQITLFTMQISTFLTKVAFKMQRIQVGNGQFVSVLLIIPIVIDIHGPRFKIFTLVSEMHDNVDLVFGIKNIFKLEGIINSQESCFNFLNRLISFSQRNR